MDALSIGLVRDLISSDTNDLRFEAFCNSLLSRVTGVTVVGTSRTADLGVDGRSLQLDALVEQVYVATSVRADVEAKIIEDALRIAATGQVKKVVFCTNRVVTEKKRTAIEEKALAALGAGVTCEILAADSLSDLAVRWPEELAAHYSFEIEQSRQRIAKLAQEPVGDIQLQVATVLASDEGQNGTDLLVDALVTEALASSPCTLNEVSSSLQRLLRLSRPFNNERISESLHRLLESGRIQELTSSRFQLTSIGREKRAEVRQNAAVESEARLLLLREQIVARVGYQVDEQQIRKLWLNLCEELGELTSRQGARLIQTLERFRETGDASALRVQTAGHLRSVCERSTRHFARDDVRTEITDALAASLTECEELAERWLLLLLSSWVAACQLGLVPEIAQQVQRPLRKLVLALDTDIVLSLICEAEPDHENLTALLSNWNNIGGRTLVVAEVLREVSTHAWIADNEFGEIATILQKRPFDRGLARYYAKNAFVRTFWSVSRTRTLSEWAQFIRVFRGTSRDDFSNIEDHLRRLKVGNKVAEPDQLSQAQLGSLEGRLRGKLARMSRLSSDDASGGMIEQDKMDRDTKALVKYAATAATLQDTSGVLLVSSSKRLQIAVRQGAPSHRIAVSPASTLSLLMSTANVSAGSQHSIASLMLQESAGEPIHFLRVELMRLLERADLTKAIPSSRLVTLERQLEHSVLDIASKKRRPAPLVRKEILSFKDKDESLNALASAFRGAALGTEVDKLLRAQDAQLRARKGGDES